MARLMLCAVRDLKVGAFMSVFTSRSRGEAVRSFGEACQEKGSPFFKHPNDFTLCIVGEWDDNSGQLIPLPGGPEPVVGAGDFVVDTTTTIRSD